MHLVKTRKAQNCSVHTSPSSDPTAIPARVPCMLKCSMPFSCRTARARHPDHRKAVESAYREKKTLVTFDLCLCRSVVVIVKCYLFHESSAARHVTVMSACDGLSSVCTESVHSKVCHCPSVAQVITVVSGADVQAFGRLNEHHLIQARKNNNGTQPVFRALDVLASQCRIHESTNHSQDHGFVS